jgi:hypothetical protein
VLPHAAAANNKSLMSVSVSDSRIDDGWDNSVKTTPLDNSLSKADLWILADFPQDIVEMISKHVDQNLLIPQTICGRNYTADILRDISRSRWFTRHFNCLYRFQFFASIVGQYLQLTSIYVT